MRRTVIEQVSVLGHYYFRTRVQRRVLWVFWVTEARGKLYEMLPDCLASIGTTYFTGIRRLGVQVMSRQQRRANARKFASKVIG